MFYQSSFLAAMVPINVCLDKHTAILSHGGESYNVWRGKNVKVYCNMATTSNRQKPSIERRLTARCFY